MKLKNKRLMIALTALLCVAILGLGAILGINGYVKTVGGKTILSSQEAAALSDIDCIIVLGCQVKDDGTPSHMLQDRLERGIELYKLGAAPKIIMSGDHGQTDYDEVNTMKQYAIDAGIPSSDIFMDHAGFSTYETIVRAKDIFCAQRVIVVTQEYHLYRALYIAKQFGLDAWGVDAAYRSYAGQMNREIREILARCKDFATSIFKPDPTFRGETIPVFGDGDITNDQRFLQEGR